MMLSVYAALQMRFLRMCVVHVDYGSKGRPGKISHVQAWDCC